MYDVQRSSHVTEANEMRQFVRTLPSVIVVIFLLQSFPAHADEWDWRAISKEEKAVLTEIIRRYMDAWNSSEVNEYIVLFHSESRFRKAFENDKGEFNRQFKEAIEEFGTIKSFEIYEYSQDKNRYNVMITFAKYGWDPVTFVTRGDNKNGWLIFDVEHRP